MKKTIFTGSGVALITPMYNDGSVNYEELDRLIDFHLDNQTDSIIACGTTGESACLDHTEHCKVIEHTVNRVNGRLPVIASTGSNDTAYAVKLTKEAEHIGADGILSVTPYYNKTSQNGLVKHFITIADSTSIPIILYSVPSRTGCAIGLNAYKELAKHPNISATKEASGDVALTARIIAECGDDMMVYSGEDNLTVPIMSLGGKGVISVFANVLPKEMHNITSLCLNGNYAEAAKLHLKYLALMDAFFMDVNPIPVKQAMKLMGFNCGDCRLPLANMEEPQIENLKSILKSYELIK